MMALLVSKGTQIILDCSVFNLQPIYHICGRTRMDMTHTSRDFSIMLWAPILKCLYE